MSTADDMPPADDLLYDAWVLLANGAYWDHTDPQGLADWEAARIRWRDRWHQTLPSSSENVEGTT